MLIKALQALTIRDHETGNLTSIAYGTVADVDSTTGNSLITDGLAEEYNSGGSGGNNSIMIIDEEIYGDDEGGILNKTWTEIMTAITNGVVCFVRADVGTEDNTALRIDLVNTCGLYDGEYVIGCGSTEYIAQTADGYPINNGGGK